MQPDPDASVDAFLDAVSDARRRTEGHALAGLMEQETGWRPMLWGTSIVGFGHVHYRYETGREGDTFVVGFSPRKAALTVYGLLSAPASSTEPLLAELGPHTLGKGCVYLQRLERVDLDVLRALVANARAGAH